MRFNTKDLDCNQKIILGLIPNLPTQAVLNEWLEKPEDFEEELDDYNKKLTIRDKIFKRYPNLEKSLIQMREEYRLERIERLRAKRDRLVAELSYIPQRQAEIDKAERRKARKFRREKLENKNKSQTQENTNEEQDGIDEDNYDLVDTDSDPEDEHLSKWSQIDELPTVVNDINSKQINQSAEMHRFRMLDNLKRRQQGLEEINFKSSLIVKTIWRYRNDEEEIEYQMLQEKMKNDVWFASCQGWFKRFKKLMRTVYNAENNEFTFYDNDHNSVLSEDYVEEPFKMPLILTSAEENELKNGLKLDKYLEKLTQPQPNSSYYLPFFCVDLNDAWEREFEVDEIDLEKEQEEKILKDYEEDMKRRYEIFKNKKKAVPDTAQVIDINKEKMQKLRTSVCESFSETNLDTILQKIPNFKFQFTEDQLAMMNSKNKNTLIIGRSGTGKSTCAILRMLAIDLLFIGKKVIRSKRSSVESSDMLPTGIKTLFLTSSKVLADDLRVFYENMWTALKSKLLGKEMTKKISVEKVVQIVEQMELNPTSFITSLGVETTSKESTKDQNQDLEEKSETGLQLGINSDQQNELIIDENKDKIEEEEEEDYDDDFQVSNEDSTGVVLDNQKVLEMMKITYEQIEKKLEDYNFRGCTNEVQVEGEETKYPIFTTVLDYYMDCHFKLGSESHFVKNHCFKLTNNKQLRNVDFDEYLDISSGRKFKELNEALASKFTDMGINKTSGTDVNLLSDRYFRLVDSVVFENEFCKEIQNYVDNCSVISKSLTYKREKFQKMVFTGGYTKLDKPSQNLIKALDLFGYKLTSQNEVDLNV